MLEVRNLGVRYGRHLALEGVSVKVAKGEICVILGANGAGKSSLLKAIAGMVRAEPGGEVTMNGKPIAGMKPHHIVEQGIALVPEGRGIFGDLTVAENLQLGAFARRARAREAATLASIYELFPRLAERKSQIVRTMSGGEQQMVAIGRALMSKPDILMLDEPSLGLSPLLSKELFRSLAEIARGGVGILLVEQNAKQSLKIADRGYLIENGLVSGENNAAALASDPAVVNAYLGGGQEAARAARPGVRLPAPFALPAGIEAMSRFLGELARRAGLIHGAFVRYLRRESPVPSAFVGRYDPAAGGDPWDMVAAETAQSNQRSRQVVSSDARNLSAEAARLAERASERLARHVRSTRLSGPAPSAFAAGPAAAPERPKEAVPPTPPAAPPSAARGLDAADLASRAAERLAGHVRRQREAVRSLSAFSATRQASVEKPAPARQEDQAVRSEAPADALDVADLVARASRRMADHMKRQRQAGLATAIAARPVAAESSTIEAERGNGAAAAPLLGHNSAGFDIDADDEATTATEGERLDFVGLAARAAAIHAAHLAASRKSLLARNFPVNGATRDHTARTGPGKSHKEN